MAPRAAIGKDLVFGLADELLNALVSRILSGICRILEGPYVLDKDVPWLF